MSIHPRTLETNRYPLFKEIFDNIPNKNILDFGGSSGNLLHFSSNEINEKNYTCIDVSADAIDQGRKEFSLSTWLHYDKYNWMYNIKGSKYLKFPKLPTSIDYIWAYSVFSHTDYADLKDTLFSFLALNPKKIAVSVLDINEQVVTEWFYNKRLNDYGSCSDIRGLTSNIAYLINNDQLIIDTQLCDYCNCEHFLALYNLNWLQNQLAKDGISINIVRPGNGLIPFLVIDNV